MRRHDGFLCGEECPVIGDAEPASGRRLPATPYPDSTERAYAAALAPLVKDLREITGGLVEDLGRYAVEDAARLTRSAALAGKLRELRDRVLGRWETSSIIRKIPLGNYVEGVDAIHRRATFEQLTRAIELSPLDLPPDSVAWIKASDGTFSTAKSVSWAKANARLIRSIAEGHLDRVADVVAEGVRVGSRAEVVATRLREGVQISARKAKSIARDQIATLQGQVVAARQTRLGIAKYRWRTVGDSRVRTAHRAREGQIFAWDKPPPDGHPGQPINCRCYAEPVLDDILRDLAGR